MINKTSFDDQKKTSSSAQRTSEQHADVENYTQTNPLLHLQQQIGNQQVMRMLAQREEGLEEEEILQAIPEVGMDGGPVSEDVAGRIQSKRGQGSSLSEGIRDHMESAFGTSFEDVRVHTDSESAALNRSISAKAFTTGSDIFMGDGASTSDNKLMAHELTHVVQQRSMDTSGPMRVNPAGDSYEREADAAAESVTSSSNTAQREPDEEMEQE